MKQTTKYKLNLIESGDAFSAAPINENTQLTEDLIAGHLENTDNPHHLTAAQVGAAAAADGIYLLDGLPPATTYLSEKGWYRFLRCSAQNHAMVGRIYHNYRSGGPGSMLFYAMLSHRTPSITVLNNTTNGSVNCYQKLRIVHDGTYLYLDLYYGHSGGNTPTPTFLCLGDADSAAEPVPFTQLGSELAEGETLLLEQSISVTPSGSVLTDATPGIGHTATGSYAGKGNYGEGHPNTLTFPFSPKFVAITPDNGTDSTGGVFFIAGQSASAGLGNNSTGSSGNALLLSWGDNSVSWYSTTSAVKQLNSGSLNYHWFAIS